MKHNIVMKKISLILLVFIGVNVFANQQDGSETVSADNETKNLFPWQESLLKEKLALNYSQVREADVFWYKTIWRVIDCREKLNLPFKYPKEPLIDIIVNAARDGKVTVYDGLDDEFTNPISPDQIGGVASGSDTIWVPDPITGEMIKTVIVNEIDFTKVNKFRLKEVWYFNSVTSTLQVRIMGIAPVLDSYDEYGNFRGELPLFWAYFPDLREILVKKQAYNPFPNSMPMSWDDLLAMRLFSSYIYKENNVRDYRIQDYASGIDALYESERIKESIFNFEHDLWSY